MIEDDNEYQRGFFNAFTAMHEELHLLEVHLQDDNGNLGETTRAVLTSIRRSMQHCEEMVRTEIEHEARLARRRNDDV